MKTASSTPPAPPAPDSDRSDDEVPVPSLPPRIRRILELAYGVEGVMSTRVWHWPGNVLVGIRPGTTSSDAELLRRVADAVSGLREPAETWDFGWLDD